MSRWASVRNDYITDTCQLDDLTTQTNLRFLMELDDQISATWLSEAIDRGLAFLLRAQYPIGCWPHEYTSEFGSKITSKAYQFKMNDQATTESMRILMMAHDRYGNSEYKEAVERAVQFLLDSQLTNGAVAGGWAQQYDQNAEINGTGHIYEPGSTRPFEHPSLSIIATYDGFLALGRYIAWKYRNGEDGDALVSSANTAFNTTASRLAALSIGGNWAHYYAYWDSTRYATYLGDLGGGVVGSSFSEGDPVYFDRSFNVYEDWTTYDAIADSQQALTTQYTTTPILAILTAWTTNPPTTHSTNSTWAIERQLITDASRAYDSGTFNPDEAINNQTSEGIWTLSNDSKNYFSSERWRTYMLRLNDFLGVDDLYSSYESANDYSGDSGRQAQSTAVNSAINSALTGLELYKTTGGWAGYQNVNDSTDRYNESFSAPIDNGFISTKEIGTAFVGSELIITYRLFSKELALSLATEAGWALACTQTYIGGWPYESKLDDYVNSYNANEVPAKVFNSFRDSF